MTTLLINSTPAPQCGEIRLKSVNSTTWQGRIGKDIVIEADSFEQVRAWFDERSLPWQKLTWTHDAYITLEQYSPNWAEVYAEKDCMSVDLECLFDEMDIVTGYTRKITVQSNSKDDAVSKIMEVLIPHISSLLYKSDKHGHEVNCGIMEV